MLGYVVWWVKMLKHVMYYECGMCIMSSMLALHTSVVYIAHADAAFLTEN